MKTIDGFKDRFGVDLRRQRLMLDVAATTAEAFGYEPVSIPIVERAEAYDPAIVGLSPWPEWNPNGCFFFEVQDYLNSYDVPSGSTAAVLIPEGTLSVTRWLGNQLGTLGAPAPELPLKIYYNLHCFRNELLTSLNDVKGRTFSQFGIEVLGSASIAADIEPMAIAHEILLSLGVESAKIAFRISSNELFLALAAATGLTHIERVHVKEQLDTIAECKAGKKPDRIHTAIADFWKVINLKPTRTIDDAWSYILSRPAGSVSKQDKLILGAFSPTTFDRIEAITEALNTSGIKCDVEYCVVRSHEYYTGITFEIDLIGTKQRYVEIGGGGRYDRLLGNFTPPDGPKVVPCTGFAFGLERLLSALVSEGFLVGQYFRHEQLLDLREIDSISYSPGNLLDNSDTTAITFANQYVATISALRTKRKKDRISVPL